MDIVLTHPRNAVSAVRLGLPVVTELTQPLASYRNIINWGRSDGPSSMNVVNKGSDIAQTVNKYSYLTALEQCSVSAPKAYEGITYLAPGTYVIRPYVHAEGDDFELITVDRNCQYRTSEGYFATQYLTPTREYRVWFAGDRYMTAKRIPRPSEDETDESCRSKWGYSFTDNFAGAIELVKKARAAVPIQFGAFDLLWQTEERKWYVLEVNSAPSLDTNRVRDFMVPGIKALMVTAEPAPVAQRITTPPPPARRRINVWTDTGLQSIEV